MKVNVRNGLYVGDLCYALNESVYYGVWGESGFQDGCYKDNEKGLEFAMLSTEYGDGCYPSNIDFDFPVDAGIIGIADLGLCDKDLNYGLVYPDYKGEVNICYEDKYICIDFDYKHIKIEIK